ncbi:MAG TPA: RsmB/NOP family class I SAM-dependent RNA methyltransferase [Chlamydiales bacterium]|jgi:16S rRNA C967 or C1407 C5-methylase (RsmB/RsmF family)
MTRPFVDTHILAFLKTWENSSKPLDLSLSDYFRSHRALGANDRREMGETIYTLVRWKGLFEHLDPSGLKSLFLLRKHSVADWLEKETVPEHVRYGLTSFLFEQFTKAYGPEKARELGSLLNTQAPIALRVNSRKISRDDFLAKLPFPGRPSTETPDGVLLAKREALFALPEFKEGLFEVQDIGSQIVANKVAAQPKERVLDYCSGSGGKTLAIAAHMGGTGELYLHDIRTHSLSEAKKRLRRAGVQNAQVLENGHPTLKKLFGKMDWVLVDVPCTGTGTLRRNPDQKEKINAQMLEELVVKQKAIVAEATRYLKPTGRLVYATCSILPEENQAQVEFFLSKLPLALESQLSLLPNAEHDGFFVAVFTKMNNQVKL